MKIITHGKRPAEPVFEGHCSKCGCVFEVKESETASGKFSFGYVHCPEPFCDQLVLCESKRILFNSYLPYDAFGDKKQFDPFCKKNSYEKYP